MKQNREKMDKNWIPGGYKYKPEKSKEQKLLESIIRKMKKQTAASTPWGAEGKTSGDMWNSAIEKCISIVQEKMKTINKY